MSRAFFWKKYGILKRELDFFNKYDIEKRKIVSMKVKEEICLKFPAVLRDKLVQNEIEFPDTTEFEYDKIYIWNKFW